MECAELLRVHAYVDRELDAVSAADVEQHMEHCGECRNLVQDLEEMRIAIRRDVTLQRASLELRGRISRALDHETGFSTAQRNTWGASTWRTRSFWLGAFGGIGSTAIAATLAFVVLSPALPDRVLDDVVDAHIRSLMPAHLVDVLSTDQHTVKPWFAGHTDVSPVVADFAPQGYTLMGGRADYLDHQRSAVVVYQHGPHVINVFSWYANQGSWPQEATRNGYHMAFWKAGDLEYCAVSDTRWDELLGLVRLLRELTARDSGHPEATVPGNKIG